MKRGILVCFLTFVVGVCFAQTIELTPMTFDGYKLHKGIVTVLDVTSVPDWKPSKIRHEDWRKTPASVSDVTENDNWIKFEECFIDNNQHTLSKDKQGNIWVVYRGFNMQVPCFIFNKTISKPEDVIGVYWVSWKLIPESKDIYPVLNPE